VSSAGDDLTNDQLSLLKDSGGWEYIKMSNPTSGIQTVHTCFDGKPHPETCSGTLTLTPDHTFAQNTFIHHQKVSRSGTYELNGNQLAFYDEFGTIDGPYTLHINTQSKSMVMEMPQIKIEMELYKEYKKDLAAKKPKSRP
jgi:hypothetical protein